MLVESRAWRVASSAVVLLVVLANPMVSRSLRRLFLLPGYDDERLVTLDRNSVHYNGYGTVSAGILHLWAPSRTFEGIFPVERWTFAGGLRGERVSSGALEAAGVQPAEGRLLRPNESGVAVVAHDWAKSSGARVGQTVRIGFLLYRIVGIMPRGFQLLSRESQVWISVPADAKHLEFVGRLREGYSRGDAQQELRALSRSSRRYGAAALEVITLRQNRQDDLLFAISILRWNLLFVLLIALGSFARFMTTSERSIGPWYQLRYLAFLVAKTTGLLVAMALLWIVIDDPAIQKFLIELAGWAVPVLFWAFLLLSWGVTFWSLRDQQNRCRICLHLLRMPVGAGQWSSLVIDRPRTEWICPYGHGTLYVPGTGLLDIDAVNWRATDPIWRELFMSSPGT